MILAEARQHVAAALANLPVPVHPYPPQAAPPPVVAVVPGVPYITAVYLDSGVDVGLQVMIVTAAHAARQMDELLHAAAVALHAAGVPIDPVPPPTTDPELGTLTGRIPLTLTWKD